MRAAGLITRTIEFDAAEGHTVEAQALSLVAEARAAIGPIAEQSWCGESKETTGIAFEGPIFEHSSLARVNREIARAAQNLDAW